jgi:thymidylate kinase
VTRTIPGLLRSATGPGGDRATGSIVIVGPDGSGKSTLTDALEAQLATDGEVIRLHGRARVLPRASRHVGPVLEPHKSTPYGTLAGLAKLAYLFVDAQLTWRVVIPRARRRGARVLVERGWLDIAVDPRRYRLRDGRMARRLARFLPRPDLTIVLDAPASDIYARKPELPMEELDRQIRAWHQVLPRARDVVWLDARRPVATLVADLAGRLAPDADVAPAGEDDREGRAEGVADARRWVALPPRPLRPRWYVPRGPGRLTRASLAVYHPITRRGLLGWRTARLAARLGLVRLLTPASPPAAPLAILAPHLGTGRHAAISTAHRDGRAHALLLDDAGIPLASVKVAIDPSDQDRLRHEAEMAERLGPLLEHPLSSPRVVDQGPGFLAFEVVPWIADRRGWDLDPRAARAIGRLYRFGAAQPGGPGFAHGDFVPWNVLRTRDGWSVIDWEHARTDAPPFEDPFRFVILASALLGRPAVEDILPGIRGEGPLGPTFLAYAEGAEVDLGIAPGRLRGHLAAWFDSSASATADPAELDVCTRLRDELESAGP